ncbi:hypothetical protein TWF481_011671 [Arthrobotrys musiformis]|uniref:Uncharacterized protein n=1 Tax=Arthrobotrys musiformis TaxID=47236 RepID=A0AAV9W1X7_9PEZI
MSSSGETESLHHSHRVNDPDPPPHRSFPSTTPHSHPFHTSRNFAQSPHIGSDNHIKGAKCFHYSRAPSGPPPGAFPSAIPKGYYLVNGILMPASSCTDPSCGPDGKLPGYIIEEIFSQSGESAGETHPPVVHLPENVPPPIVLSESGYPMGIAGPDGSPAWAKPKAPTRPPRYERGYERNHHKNVHHSHNHHHPAGLQAGPEFLVPMGTPVRNPYGPGVVFLPPSDPRIIPCRQGRDSGHIVDYDDMDTIPGDRLRHQRSRAAFDPHATRNYRPDEDTNTEYACMKLRAEQNERARIEEIERNQALRNARQKEHEKKAWLAAMGKTEEETEVGTGNYIRHTAPYDDERVININVRKPCEKCQELVTVETVHQRFSAHDSTQRIGINLDSPAPKLHEEVLCEKCKIAKAEEQKNTDLLRKLVRQVFNEADNLKKAKNDDPIHGISPAYSHGATKTEYSEFVDPRAVSNEPLLHDGKKSAYFENMPEKIFVSSKQTPHGRRSTHHLHGHTKSHMSNFQDDSDEYSSPRRTRVTQPNFTPVSGNRLSRNVFASLDREHVPNKENVHIISSIDNSDDDSQEEEEVIVIRRARRNNDKSKGLGSRSHPVLVKSATENPDETIEAVTRRLANHFTFSPTKIDGVHRSRKLRNHAGEEHQEGDSDSGFSSYSAFVRKYGGSSHPSNRRNTNDRTSHHNRGVRGRSTTPKGHHFHHREHTDGDDDGGIPMRHSRNRQPGPDDNPGELSDNAPFGFLSGWGLFRKSTF